MSYDDTIHLLLAVSMCLVAIGTMKASNAVAFGDASHLFEPQWKREARELARYIPEADEWGR